MSKIIKKWYVIQTISGFENKVSKYIKKYTKLNDVKYIIDEIIIPTEEVIEIRGGKKRRSERKFFPGYILIKMLMNNYVWHLINNIPKVIGFIGGTSDKPSPVSEKEINIIINRLKQIGDKPRPKTLFEIGELVRVKEGPFSDFNGIVEEVDYEKNRLKLSVSIFGRATPVDLDFSQVDKG